MKKGLYSEIRTNSLLPVSPRSGFPVVRKRRSQLSSLQMIYLLQIRAKNNENEDVTNNKKKSVFENRSKSVGKQLFEYSE